MIVVVAFVDPVWLVWLEWMAIESGFLDGNAAGRGILGFLELT